jgi:hypothetical protein
LNFRPALSWSNALTCTLVLGCIALAGMLLRGKSAPVSVNLPALMGRAVALPSNSQPLPDPAAEEELLSRQIPVSVLNQARTLELEVRSVSAAAHCNIVIDWGALESEKIDREVPYALSWTPDLRPAASVRLDQGLRWILDSINDVRLAYVVEDGVILISTEAELAKHTSCVVYDFRDLIDADAATDYTRVAATERMRRLLFDTIARESWTENGGTTGSIEVLAGLFVITQTAPNHRHILELLANLRAARRAKPTTRLSASAGTESPTTRSSHDAAETILHQKVTTWRLSDLVTSESAMRNLSDAAKIRIYVDWNSLEPAGIKRNDWPRSGGTYEDIPLGEAIRMILVPSGTLNEFTIEEEGGGLVIGMRISTQLCDVRDLIAAYVKAARASGDTRPLDVVHSEAVEHLKIMVCGLVDRTSWIENSGSVGSINEFMGILAVTQSSAAQARVAELLHKVRATGLAAPTTRASGR